LCGDNSVVTITNCIVWRNTGAEIHKGGGVDVDVIYSDVEGGHLGEGNIDADPCFADATNNDYHLKSEVGRWDPASRMWVQDEVTSPCIDAGDPRSDWKAEPLPNGCRINMGMYGGTAEASLSLLDCWITADFDNSGGVDFIDFAALARCWREFSRRIPHGTVVVDGDVSEWLLGTQWASLDTIYLPNPNDVTDAMFALRWNESTNKVYVAVMVEDHDHIFRDDYGVWDASDRIEVYSQGDSAGGSGWTWTYDVAQHYMVGPNTSGGGWANWSHGEAISPDVGLEYAVAVTGDWITYEVGVPQFDNYGGFSGGETVETQLREGHVVRFDVVVDTRWGADGFGMLSENDMTGKFDNADSIALYMLVDELAPGCDYPTGDLDENGVLDYADLAIFADEWLWGK
jgi:hypothetical protein